ncbi:MAG: beta-galactosidase trimerization domain-containing protein, partial [Victivallales bacterium]|nr:beta-galactosidase trimerization domain-containing protein [Victivallales bacterium]
GNAGEPPKFWTRDSQGLAYLKKETDDITHAKEADCIFIESCGASAFTPEMVKEILQAVERGAGLVICAFDQPYYPYKDGRRQEAVEKLRTLFAPAFEKKETKDTDFVKISAAQNLSAEFGSYGKGRAVLLLEAQNIKGYERIFFEIRQAVVGKALCWACGRVPQTRLRNAQQDETGLTVQVASPTPLQANLTLADMNCREMLNKQFGAQTGENLFPIHLPSIGKYPAVIRLIKDGATLDWDIVLLEKQGQGLFKELTVRQHAPVIKGHAVLARKPLPGETIDIQLRDGYGTLWKRWTKEARTKTYFELPTEGIAAVGGTLTLLLKSPQGETLDQTTAEVTLSTGDDPNNPVFNLGVWGIPLDNYPSWLYHNILKDTYGLDYRLTGNHARMPWDLQKLNIRSMPSGAPGQLYFGKNNHVIGDSHAPEREVCLSSEKLKKDLGKKIKAVSAPLKGIDAKCYFMDHETNLLGYINKAKPGSDYCFSPSCRASLVALVKPEYGTLEKLNATWGTAFQTWEEVTPIVLKDACLTGLAPRWIDHRRNMDKVWTDLLRFRIGELRKYDPKAMGYIQNLHSAYSSNDSFSGIDYEQMLECELGAGAMPESYIDAFSRYGNRPANAQGGAMWYPFGGAVDDSALNCIRAERVIWQTILMGNCCCLYYLHNFNDSSSLLFNDIFLVNPDLTISPEGAALAEGVRRMRQGIDRLVLTAAKDNSGIEMLYSRASEHACTFWQAMVKECPTASSLNPRQQQFEFFAPAIEQAGRDFSSTASKLLRDGGLAKRRAKLLILPFAQSISPEDAQEIRAFVQNGGCVLADFRPALTDQHGALGNAGLLDDVFGIRQSLTWHFRPRQSQVSIGKWRFRQALAGEPIQLTTAKAREHIGDTPIFLENRYGKGNAVLLNFSTREPAFRTFFGEWLDSCGIPKLFTANILRKTWRTGHGAVGEEQIVAEQAASDTEIQDKTASEDPGERETQVYQNTSLPKLHRLTSGSASILGYYACRRGFALGQGDMEVEFSIPQEGFVYDLMEGRCLERRSSWKTTMPLEGVKIYGVLPFPAQAPKLGTPSIEEQAGAKLVRLTLDLPKEAASIAYPVRITPITPDGRALSCYAKTITVRNARAEFSLLLPADAVRGEWRISARETFGGHTSIVGFAL